LRRSSRTRTMSSASPRPDAADERHQQKRFVALGQVRRRAAA
jgi:hypothetical protein